MIGIFVFLLLRGDIFATYSIFLLRMKLEVSERETLGDHFFIKIKIAEQKRGRGNNASTNYLVAGKFPFLDLCVRDPSYTAGTWVCHPRAGRFHIYIIPK